MGDIVETGMVKFFKQEEAKDSWGFIVPEGEDKAPVPDAVDVYFQYSAANMIGQDGESPVFVGRSAERAGETREPRIPVKGDRVVFIREVVNGKPRAKTWGFEGLWEIYRDWLGKRPDVRVVQIAEPDMVEVVWEGVNLYELSCLYPLRTVLRDGEHHLVDDLELLASGVAECVFEFEVHLDGGWQACGGDPRARLCCVPLVAFAKYRRDPNVRQGVCLHVL